MHSKSFSAQKFDGRWMRRSLAAVLFLLVTLAAAQKADATSLTPWPDCLEGTEGPALELVWQGLPDEDSHFRQPGWGLTLTLVNHTGRELLVELSAAAVLDDQRESMTVGNVVIGAGSVISLPVNVGALGVNPSTLDYSARLVAKAIARVDDGMPVAYLAYSPHAFYHVENGRLHVYRRSALIDTYGSGDYGDRALVIRQWAADRGLRPLSVGRYNSDLPLTDDDGGPPDPDPNNPHPNHRHTHGSSFEEILR